MALVLYTTYPQHNALWSWVDRGNLKLLADEDSGDLLVVGTNPTDNDKFVIQTLDPRRSFCARKGG